MNSILVSNKPEKYAAARPIRSAETKPVPLRHRFVIELKLAGKDTSEIEELSGYSKPMIYRILSSDEAQGIKQQIMKHYDIDFESQYKDVIDAIKDGLVSIDPKVQLDAAKIWLKYHKVSPDSKAQAGDTYNVTAEDVVFQILNQENRGESEPASSSLGSSLKGQRV